MKKLLIALLVLVLALALFACGTPDETTIPDETTAPINDDTTVDPGNHTHDHIETVILAPTCTSLGQSGKKCSCGDVLDDSVLPLPFATHDANQATCTEDSVCRTCGKVLVEKYGHFFVETVVKEVSCTSAGEITTKCSRCGITGETKVIHAYHQFDMETLKVSKGNVSATCSKCGVNVSLLSATPELELNFDSAAELNALSGFKVEKPSGLKFENGACQVAGGALWLGYEREFVTSMSKFIISFDFKLMEQGMTTRGESIFSFTAATPADYKGIVKFYQASGVLSTVGSGFNESNSVSATQGKWYNLVAVVDTATSKATVYIDGVNIGTSDITNHANERHTNFRFRFFDIPANATSNPYFDNFKLIKIS